MPISRIKSSAINNDSVTSAKIDDGTIVAVDIADDAVTTAKLNGLTNSSSGFIKADGDGTLSVATADLVDDTTPQLGGDLDGNGFTVDLTANTSYIGIPTGTTAQRPGSPSTGYTRMNTTLGSIEFYDGANWIATNLIPTVDSVSGVITDAFATSLTLSLTNSTDTISVVFKESGTTLATVSDVTVSSGSASVTVPSAVYGQTAGDTIAVSIVNQDGTPSSNSQTVTVTAAPSGGTITTSGDYRIHTFTSSGTFTNTISTTAEYLVVAGGGGGGGGATNQNDGGGGGGAGGMLTGSTSITAQSYSIVIGAGGNGGPVQTNATSGSNSTAFGLTAIGGGHGSLPNTSGGNGGSGGGAGGGGGGGNNGGSGTIGQGYAGGGHNSFYPYTGGGGGGKNAAGGLANPTSGGSGNGYGGAGGASSISGSSVTYAGGGSGGHGTINGSHNSGDYRNNPNPQTSGAGVGGTYTSSATNGAANRGHGGGGGATSNNPPTKTGGNGGAGIVIVRYDTTAI